MDEAGAYLEVHPVEYRQRSYVTKAIIQQILTKVCKIDAAAIKDENNDSLATLRQRILDKIYGQDKAVDKVVEAVMMAKAGLVDDDKPMASLLFVGPTGVGKTEVVRVLAKELGIELVRFDMSEYTEKHTVLSSSVRLPDTWVMKMAVFLPMPSARHQTVYSCSMRLRRRIATSTTSCFR